MINCKKIWFSLVIKKRFFFFSTPFSWSKINLIDNLKIGSLDLIPCRWDRKETLSSIVSCIQVITNVLARRESSIHPENISHDHFSQEKKIRKKIQFNVYFHFLKTSCWCFPKGCWTKLERKAASFPMRYGSLGNVFSHFKELDNEKVVFMQYIKWKTSILQLIWYILSFQNGWIVVILQIDIRPARSLSNSSL